MARIESYRCDRCATAPAAWHLMPLVPERTVDAPENTAAYWAAAVAQSQLYSIPVVKEKSLYPATLGSGYSGLHLCGECLLKQAEDNLAKDAVETIADKDGS